MIQRNYDPPHPPTNNSPNSTPQASPQQGSSNTFQTQHQTLTRTHFHLTTPPQQSTQPLQYFPAQSSL